MMLRSQRKLSAAHKAWLDHRAMRIRLNVPIHTILDFYGIGHTAPTGGDGSAHCPFHGEDHTPSAYVYGDTNKLFCHKCQQGWDVVGLVRTYHGGKLKCSYTRALNLVEKMFELPRLPYPEDEPKFEESKPKDKDKDKDKDDGDKESTTSEKSEPRLVESEPRLVESELDSEVEDDGARKRRAWEVRRDLDRALIEYRDQVRLSAFTQLCRAVDRTVRHIELGLLSEEQIRERVSRIRRKLFRVSHA